MNCDDLRKTLTVGPGMQFPTVQQAYNAATDNTLIEISAGLYFGEDAMLHINCARNVTFRGVGGLAKMHLDRTHLPLEEKGIWLANAANITIENIEFCGANLDRDKNGAGIRIDTGATGDLIIRGCYFHHNNNGILGGYKNVDILIEHSRFEYNGYGDGYSHNMYINHARSFTLRNCYVSRVNKGHLVKTRALNNFILNNKIVQECDWGEPFNHNHNLDIPDAGNAHIEGNIFHKGKNSNGVALISYAKEDRLNPGNKAYIINNTFVSEAETGRFLFSPHAGYFIEAVNNVFVGKDNIYEGAENLTAVGNVHSKIEIVKREENQTYYIDYSFGQLANEIVGKGAGLLS